MTPNLGILAYGSLIDKPGEEIAAATIRVMRGMKSPFRVEFARSSKTRAGAPTLVPVLSGGAHVPACIFILRGNVSEEEARAMVWRRETGRKRPRRQSRPSNHRPDDVVIDELTDFHGVRKVLYTRIAANIVPLTAENLATLALNSMEDAKVFAKHRDGISYLIAALRNGIHTELSQAYEQEVLKRTGAQTLSELISLVRSSHRAG